MRVRLIKSCTYYAHPFSFSIQEPEKDVPKELGEHLLTTGYFKEIERVQDVEDGAEETLEDEETLESEKEKEAKASKSNKLYEESKKTTTKK